jgi:hypothetical protein
VDLAAARAIALDLPGAHEEPHFDLTSFRIGTKIFATAPPDGDELRIFVDEGEARACAQEDPTTFEVLMWGQKVSGVAIRLSGADAERVTELLEESWRRRATKRAIAELDARGAADR